jgi:hypothetical protein
VAYAGGQRTLEEQGERLNDTQNQKRTLKSDGNEGNLFVSLHQMTQNWPRNDAAICAGQIGLPAEAISSIVLCAARKGTAT